MQLYVEVHLSVHAVNSLAFELNLTFKQLLHNGLHVLYTITVLRSKSFHSFT